MRFYAHEKLVLAIDGGSTYHTAKNIGLDIDWAKLENFFARQATLVTSGYFTQLNLTEEFTPIKPLVDWLAYNGWNTIACDGHPHVAMAVWLLEMADRIDHFIIGTGDEIFLTLFLALQRHGARVTLLSSVRGGCSDELRRTANDFLDLAEISSVIAREPRAAKVPA